MIFLDDNGNELEMKVGKTFIQIVNNDQSVIVNAGEQIDGAAAQATPAPTATPKPTRTRSRPAPRRLARTPLRFRLKAKKMPMRMFPSAAD